MGKIFVVEDEDFCAREAGAVDDGSVVQLIGNDEVFLAQDRRHGSRVGREA